MSGQTPSYSLLHSVQPCPTRSNQGLIKKHTFGCVKGLNGNDDTPANKSKPATVGGPIYSLNNVFPLGARCYQTSSLLGSEQLFCPDRLATKIGRVAQAALEAAAAAYGFFR